jgi:glutaredoxin 3
MTDIVIYTRPGCGYCSLAKQLIDSKGKEFTEYNIWAKDEYKADMTKLTGGANTVPQIFINDDHIGGSDELYALDRAGHLDALLSQ